MRFLLTTLCLVVCSIPSDAAVITISPTSQTVPSSSLVAVDVVISGLGVGSAPSVGVYDLTIGFDSSVLSFSSVSWGNGLDVFALGSLQTHSVGLGTVSLFELSLDSASDLDSLQSDSFRLFTLSFTTLTTGSTPVVIAVNALGDGNGASLPVTVAGGSVTVGTTSSVPEPGTSVAVLIGIGALFFLRRIPGTTLTL